MNLILKVCSEFISSLFMMSIIIYIWHKLLNEKLNFKSKRIYIVLFGLTFISIFNYYIVNQFIRILSITFFLTIAFVLLFRKRIDNRILTPIYTQVIFMISEFIFAIFITVCLGLSSTDIVNSQFANFFANIFIALISVILVKFKIIRIIYNKLIKITDKINNKHLILITLFTILIANILTMVLYYKIEFSYLLIFNTFLTLFCFGIVLYSFNAKNNYIKVYDKYNTTLNSLKEYENILDRYKILNHENKNQLLTIRNMINKTEKNTITYIDKIIENKLKDDNKVLFDVIKIPEGGLRGLIYSKILFMKKLKIKYELVISKQIKTKDFINNIDDSIMLDICKIIGVYLDNAIQAVEKLRSKFINIEMYLENNNIIISISNNYQGQLDLEKFEEKGYTTKGKNHGYGLSLAKELIYNNKVLSNEMKINKTIFTQILKIKM